MVRALGILKTGDYNPHFFDYPGFYIYAQALVAALQFLVGASRGLWMSLNQVSPTDFYLWGRALTAALGSATVGLVYLAGRRWGTGHALLAAALLAVLPIHVRESHFVLTDVPMTFFVTLTLVLSLRANEQRVPSAFAWAGVAAGLAAGTKYTAWVAVLLPLAGAVLMAAPAVIRARAAVAALGGFFGAYVLAAPYTVLDLPGFLNGFGALAEHVPMHRAFDEPGALVHFKNLRNAIGWPSVVFGAAGAVLSALQARRGPARARSAMVLVFPLVFFPMLTNRAMVYARYMMPALPFVCLLVASGAIATATVLRRWRIPPLAGTAATVGVVVVVLATPTAISVGFDRNAGRPQTYGVAFDWIMKNIRPHSRLVHSLASFQLPEGRYDVQQVDSVTDHDFEYLPPYRDGVSDRRHRGGTAGPHRTTPPEARELFSRLELLVDVEPGPDLPGLAVKIFRVPRPVAPPG